MSYTTVEALESRIAPAAVASVPYIDRDGDDVVIKVTTPTGTSAALQTALDAAKVFSLEGIGLQLTSLNLSNAIFENASVSIIARKSASGGDGFAAVGSLSAPGRNLRSVVVDGDVGQFSSATINSLTVQSIGAYGLTTGAGNEISLVTGNIGKLVVKEDVRAVSLFLTSADSISVGGSLIGAGATEGVISLLEDVGTVNIRGSLRSADGVESGRLSVFGDAKTITIGGSVYGSEVVGLAAIGQVRVGGDLGKLLIAGSVFAGNRGFDPDVAQIELEGNAKSIEIRGNLIGTVTDGSSGIRSGKLAVDGSVGSLTIGGSIFGGGTAETGAIEGGVVKSFQLKGDLTRGGSESGAFIKLDGAEKISIGGSLFDGVVRVSGPLVKSVVVGGSIIGMGAGSKGILGDVNATLIEKIIIGGNIESNAGTDLPATIFAKNLGSVRIKGDIITGEASVGASYEIRAASSIGQVIVDGSLIGNADNTAKIFANDIGSVLVKKDAQYAEIVATSGFNGMKSLTVNGSWVGSRFAMNTQPGADTIYGTHDDVQGGIASVAKIIIKGQVTGTFGGTDSFRIYAGKIGSAVISGNKLTFGAGVQSYNFSITGDVIIADVE